MELRQELVERLQGSLEALKLIRQGWVPASTAAVTITWRIRRLCDRLALPHQRKNVEPIAAKPAELRLDRPEPRPVFSAPCRKAPVVRRTSCRREFLNG